MVRTVLTIVDRSLHKDTMPTTRPSATAACVDAHPGAEFNLATSSFSGNRSSHAGPAFRGKRFVRNGSLSWSRRIVE